MRYDSFSYLLLLGWVQLISFRDLVNHIDAAVYIIMLIVYNGSDTNFLFTAGILVLTAERTIDTGFGLGLLVMHVTVAHLGDVVEQGASVALENVEVRPDFPIDFSPGDSISLPNESYKLFKVPGLVDYVLGSDLAITVDVALGL